MSATRIRPGLLKRTRALRAKRLTPVTYAGTVARAIVLLREARFLLSLCAPRAAQRVRAALRSAEGAQRHADLAEFRATRQQRQLLGRSA